MMCKKCGHRMDLRGIKKRIWLCQYCGHTEKYVPEPIEEGKFVDVERLIE